MNITIDIDLRALFGAAREQYLRPTCVAFAASAAHEHRRARTHYLSPEYLFHAAAQRTHKDPQQGLKPDAVGDALRLDGQPDELGWPYVAATPTAKNWFPPASSGHLYRADFEVSPRTVSEVIASVKAGTPVVLFIEMTEALYSPDVHGTVRGRSHDKKTGRHALLAVGSGYATDGDYVLVRNSWGAKWGNAGHGWLHEPYLKQHLVTTGTVAGKK